MNKEIVIVMGYPASGKSTTVQQFVDRGYTRLNRDSVGGSMDQLNRLAEKTLLDTNLLVLDNLYPSVESRKPIIALAKRHKLPVRCVHLTTSLEEAQMNACLRMIRKTGRVLMPEDFKDARDPNLFPPAVIYKYRKEFQKPTRAEGFDFVEEVPFTRNWGPEYVNKALIVDYDGTLRLSAGPQKFPYEFDHIKMLPGRSERLKEYQKKGYVLLGASNQSGIARGTPAEKVVACFEETNRRLGVKIDYQFCPHRVPPITCFCRKPAPGMGAYFIEKYKLNPAQCIMVGDMGSDKTFAERCGFQYVDANEFFK